MSEVSFLGAFLLDVQGLVSGKGRPRFNTKTGRTYTPKETQTAEAAIQEEWIDAGRPRLEGPLTVNVTVYMARPGSHYRVNGELNAEGLRNPYPTKKPDVDNVLKLALDALNGRAFHDDAQVVQATVKRLWASRGCPEGTVIAGLEMEAP